MSERTSTDLRTTLGPALLAVLAGTLFLANQALDGGAQMVARIVLLTALVAATAWCGSVFWHSNRADSDGQG
ncbi:MAG: hypothetical protein LC679_08900 [Intrasporangiaceae bacterium]|nr:hypothetical protein [Intrasporangiaceae bacterium]